MIILQGITTEELLKRIEEIVERIVEKKIEEKLKIQQKEKFNYLTRKEVAKVLRITLPTLHEWTKQGLIPGHRIGTRVLYKSSEIENAVEGIKKFRRNFGERYFIL